MLLASYLSLKLNIIISASCFDPHTQGTNLWKSNRKDECYDLYLECCQDCFDRLLTPELRSPLSDAMSSGKVLGLQNKQRGAVVLRKAIDKLLSDTDKVTTLRVVDLLINFRFTFNIDSFALRCFTSPICARRRRTRQGS